MPAGWGRQGPNPALVYLIVREQLAPLLVVEDPSRVEELWESMYALTRWYGRKGAALSALGGVDMALWDLRGRAAGKPVCLRILLVGLPCANPLRQKILKVTARRGK